MQSLHRRRASTTILPSPSPSTSTGSASSSTSTADGTHGQAFSVGRMETPYPGQGLEHGEGALPLRLIPSAAAAFPQARAVLVCEQLQQGKGLQSLGGDTPCEGLAAWLRVGPTPRVTAGSEAADRLASRGGDTCTDRRDGRRSRPMETLEVSWQAPCHRARLKGRVMSISRFTPGRMSDGNCLSYCPPAVPEPHGGS
jgi:hypothetical protein